MAIGRRCHQRLQPLLPPLRFSSCRFLCVDAGRRIRAWQDMVGEGHIFTAPPGPHCSPPHRITSRRDMHPAFEAYLEAIAFPVSRACAACLTLTGCRHMGMQRRLAHDQASTTARRLPWACTSRSLRRIRREAGIKLRRQKPYSRREASWDRRGEYSSNIPHCSLSDLYTQSGL